MEFFTRKLSFSLLHYALWILYFASISDGCTSWPTSWDSTWYDSSYGTVTFTSSTYKVSGYSVTAYASTVTSWTCQYEDTTNNYIVFRGDTTVDLYGAPQYAYLCFQYTKVTDNSYHYYLLSDVEINAGNARVLIIDAGATQPSAASGYCSPTSGPSAEEFIMLVKQGYEANVKQTCPTPLQGVFSYTSNDGSTSSCGSGSRVDVCTSTDTMTYDYTQCSTVQAFSQEGEVYCVSYVTSGSNYFVYALNPGTVDNTNYYRFTCFAVATSGSNVVASQNPNNCETGQTPTARPSSGLLNVFTAYYTCPTATTTTTAATATTASAGGISLGLIVGAIAGALLLILAAILIIVCCKKCKREKDKVGANERENSDIPPKGNDMVVEPLTPRDALTVNPEDSAAKNRLTPIELSTSSDPPGYAPPLPPITSTSRF